VVSLNSLVSLELNNLDHVDQLVQLLGYLLERSALYTHHNGDARKAFDLGGSHGERLDVEPTASK
jgi:hypothetical protein